MNFLSTHDTERAITAIAGEPCNGRDRYWQSKRVIPSGLMDEAIRRLLLGYAMIFTLPGVPCVYYGDEIAMQGYRDPFNRAFFDWNSTEQRLRGPIKTLAALRRSCDAFDGGRLEIVRADGGYSPLPPRRRCPDGGDHPEPRPASDCRGSLRQEHRGQPRRLHRAGRGQPPGACGVFFCLLIRGRVPPLPLSATPIYSSL